MLTIFTLFVYRLVGLLMVTRALPAGDHATVQQVYDAVGPSFLARLLLPLRKTSSPGSQQVPLDVETAQKQIGMAALGLAVLSSAAQVEEIASSQEFMQLTPLFLNVVRAGGVSPLILPSKPEELPQFDTNTDSGAVRDALECAAAVAASCEEGQRIAEESGGLHASAEVLRRFATISLSETNSKLSSEEAPPSFHSAELWAVRLAAAILAGNDRTAIIEQNTASVEALIPGLAYTFALPALLQQENAKRNAAVIHLESLHALLLLLPLPLPQAVSAHESLTQSALESLWARHIRLGIGMILRGKAAAVQRHSALRLAAAMVDMFSPRWLFYPLGGQPLANNASTTVYTSSNEDEGGAFYQLLLEVIKIETNILLYDALSPSSHVPLSSAPGTAAENWKAPSTAASKVDYTTDSDNDDGIVEIGEIEEMEKVEEKVESIEQSAKRQEERKQEEGEKPKQSVTSVVDGIDITMRDTQANTWAHGPRESAGDRALQMLPCCFFLVEACIEALAEDNDAEEDRINTTMLSDAVAQRALASLLECVDILLQVLEQEQEDQDQHDEAGEDHLGKIDDGDKDASTNTPNKRSDSLKLNALKLGAVRVLGRFLAEVPDAFEDRARNLLPRLLAISSSLYSSESSPLLEIPQGDSPTATVSLLEAAAAGPAEGTCFFLPMLLQVTDPTRSSIQDIEVSTSCMKWIEAIVKGGSLRQLVDFAVETAEAMSVSAVAPSSGTQQQGIKEENEDEDSFMVVCRVLLQIITQVEQLAIVASSPSSSEKNGTVNEVNKQQSMIALEFAVADASWPLIPALNEILANHLLGSPPLANTVEDIACLAALLAAVMEAVADEADHPDEAHRAQHELFTRATTSKKTRAGKAVGSRSGVGPVSGEDVQQACNLVLQSMQFIRNTLEIKKNSGTSDVGQVESDFRCLVHSAQCLITSCLMFKEAIEKNSSTSAVDLFKELSLL
jgi:hypothetical protein